MRKFFAVMAIAACSLLMTVGGGQAQPGAGILFPSQIIQVQSRACECREACYDTQCSEVCPRGCFGRCAVRYRLGVRACLRRCGVCRFPR
jgi:hypothetical protein